MNKTQLFSIPTVRTPLNLTEVNELKLTLKKMQEKAYKALADADELTRQNERLTNENGKLVREKKYLCTHIKKNETPLWCQAIKNSFYKIFFPAWWKKRSDEKIHHIIELERTADSQLRKSNFPWNDREE